MKSEPIQVKVDIWNEHEEYLWGTTDHAEFYKVFDFPSAPLMQIGNKLNLDGKERIIKNIHLGPEEKLRPRNHNEDKGQFFQNNLHIVVVVE